MNWEAIGAIGEIVGALAVVVTLVYLVIQIRQNTAAVATATYESTMSGFNDINVVVASDPKLASLLDRGTQSTEALSAEEITQFNFLLRCYANQWWKLLKLHERGSLSEADWSVFAIKAAQFLDQPGCRPFRSQNRLFADLYLELDKHQGSVMSDFGFSTGEK